MVAGFSRKVPEKVVLELDFWVPGLENDHHCHSKSEVSPGSSGVGN